MNLLLIGYGKMGKAIEAIAQSRGHHIVGTPDTYDELKKFSHADVAIEFTQPDAVVRNLHYCFEQHIPVVCGTTGWLDKLPQVEKCCTEKNGGLFYSSNFSIGVQLFFLLNAYTAKIMQGQPYQVSIDETHHTQKKDAPSGTAISIAQGICQQNSAYHTWTMNEPKAHEILIRAHRIDPAPGTHVVHYTSPIDTIEISHTAHSRTGFAEGALNVAEWMVGKSGIYQMNDYLKTFLHFL